MAVDKLTGLVSLGDAKRFMKIADTDTDDDRLIDALVMHASVMIQNELGFNVKSRRYREYHSGDGGYDLWLENSPVTSIERASVGRDDVITVEYDGGDASYATVEVVDRAVTFRKKVSGVSTTNRLPMSDYATLTALDTAIDALSGWSSTLTSAYANYSPSDLVKRPARHANDASATLSVPDESEINYEIEDEDAGRLYNPYGWDSGHKNILIEYTAGYDKVPQPIQSATLELVKLMYDTSSRDTSLKAEKIGDYSYSVADRLDTVFSATGTTKVANMIMAKLYPYVKTTIYGA